MSFILSKILWPLASPANLIAVLVLAALALSRWGTRPRTNGWEHRFVTGLSLISGGLLLATTLLPVGVWLIRPLEARFPALTLPERVDGVIVLGGAVDVSASAQWHRPAMNHAADRMVEFSWLARRYPQAKLVFTGGSGSLSHPDLTEAPVARQIFDRLGTPPERLLFEGQSRNTYENALFSKELVKPQPGEVWILVTSAMHMPRSVGIFRKLDWPVLPDPVAYRTGEPDTTPIGLNLAANLFQLDDAVHEWLGLISYYLMNRTDQLFPGPAP